MRRRRALPVLLAALLALPAPVLAARTSGTTYVYSRLAAPARTVVSDSRGAWVATFTDGARTVTLRGSSRTWAEAAYTTATVTGTTWVRLLPRPFAGTVDATWLTARLKDTSPDVLALAFQYVVGAAPLLDATGRQIAGDASYGPLQADGTRAEGSDFNDYLGVTWTYPSGTDAPEAAQVRSLDCSGFMRMVLGYRSGVPLALAPDAGASLPRRAVDQAASAPGVVLIPNDGTVPASRAVLAPGDLVFFDAAADDGTAIDHVGMYLGRDSDGRDRFVSSRKSADGPTMGDLNGRSVLDGTGFYASAFRAARRI